MMKNFRETFGKKLRSIGNAEFLDDSSAVVKIPVWDMCFLPIGVLLFRFKRFLCLGALFSLFISILALCMREGYFCGFAEWGDDAYFGCSKSMPMYITFFLLRLLIISVFLRAWYRSAVCGSDINIREALTISPLDWKMFISLLIVLGFLCLPIISIYALVLRVPNPDWRIESLYFAVASSGIWMPLVGLRFFSIPAFVMAGEQRPGLKVFWCKTADNTLKLLLSIALIFLLNSILLINFNVFAVSLIEFSAVTALLADFIYNLLFLLMVASFCSVSIVQKEMLFAWTDDNAPEKKEA